jgi:hypothetical protein
MTSSNAPTRTDASGDARPALRLAFLVLAVVGLVLPWFYNLQYFAAGGSVMPDVFFRDASANALTTAITWDVYIAAVAFSVAVAADRAMGRWRWWAVVATFCVGLSLALPAYAWWRLGRRGLQG